MFKTRKATIGKVRIRLDGGLHRLDYGTANLIPLSEKINYDEYLSPITIAMNIITATKNKYSPIDWILVGDPDSFNFNFTLNLFFSITLL